MIKIKYIKYSLVSIEELSVFYSSLLQFDVQMRAVRAHHFSYQTVDGRNNFSKRDSQTLPN